MMTRDEILALADLLARATKGPWEARNSTLWVMACDMCVAQMRGWGYLTGRGGDGPKLSEADAINIQKANLALITQAPAMAETLLAMQAELEAERAAREKLETKWAEGCCLGLPPEECAQVPGRHCQGIGTQDD